MRVADQGYELTELDRSETSAPTRRPTSTALLALLAGRPAVTPPIRIAPA